MARKPAIKKENVKTSKTSRYPKRDLSKTKEKLAPSTSSLKKQAKNKLPPTQKKSPAKKTNKKLADVKIKKKSERKTHPSYTRMIGEALKQLAPSKGIGYKSITYFIDENYPVTKNFRRYVKQALNTGIESGIFQLAPIAKYRLSPKGRKSLEPALKKHKKPANKKVTAQSNNKKRKGSTISIESKPKKKPRKSSKEEKKKSTVEKKKKQPKKPIADIANINTLKEKSKFSHIWQYKENNGTWGNYDLKASDQLEEVYLAYLDNREGTDIRTVKSGQWEYEVNFKNMQQTNIQHPSHNVRSIRRVGLHS